MPSEYDETREPDTRQIYLPLPRYHQRPILWDGSRFKLVRAGRRFGKTTVGLIASLAGHGPLDDNGIPKFRGAVHGAKIWWVAPTYTSLRDSWRDVKSCTRDAWEAKNETEHRIELPGGGSITLKSTDEYDNLRGPGVDGMVLDESAYMDPRAWHQVLRAMLADRKGWALFIGTPKGKNWWWRLNESIPARPNWNRWHGVSTDNPEFTLDELEDIKSELSPLDFAQEYMAEFVTPGGTRFQEEWFQYYEYTPTGDVKLFRPIEVHTDEETGDEIRADYEEAIYSPRELTRIASVDLASSKRIGSDFTVVQIWDVTPTRDQLLVHQFRGRIEGPDQEPLLQTLYDEYRPTYFAIETVAYQQTLVQEAIAAGLPVREVKPKGDKLTRATGPAQRAKQGKVFLEAGAAYNEMFMREIVGFPDGDHDDQVDAFVYASLEVSTVGRNMLFRPKDLIKAFTLPDPRIIDLPIPVTSVQDILAHLSPALISDGYMLWHAHLSVNTAEDYASLAVGRIIMWQSRVALAEGQPYEIQAPIFEVPLFMKFKNATDENTVDLGIITDAILALKQVRLFNITSASVSNAPTASGLQKLIRADIALLGARIDSTTGLPSGAPGQYVVADQAYKDLKSAIRDERVELVDSGQLRNELLQVEDNGKSIAHDDTSGSAVAGVVGFLSKHGHQLVQEADTGYVSLEEAGYLPYDWNRG